MKHWVCQYWRRQGQGQVGNMSLSLFKEVCLGTGMRCWTPKSEEGMAQVQGAGSVSVQRVWTQV